MAKILSMDLKKYVESMKLKGLCREKKNDYACLCPDCYEKHKRQGLPYSKTKLWIDKSYSYGHCFVCGLVVLSEDQSLNFNVKRLEDDFDINNWKVHKLGDGEDDDKYYTLDKYQQFNEEDEIGIDYLVKKRLYLYRNLYKLLGIKFQDHNPVTPFYYKGELIYYQIRIIDKSSKIKYYSPRIQHKPAYIIENSNNNIFIICEGTYDAIAEKIMHPEWTPFAVLGSDITKYQIAMLRSYVPDKIYIQMDKTEISRRIRDSIQQYIDYADIEIIPSDGTDPEELLKENIMLNSEKLY